MGGIKDVKLMGLEETYLRRFQEPSRRMAVAAAASTVIGEMPRNILKAIGYGSLMFFVLFLLVTGDGTLGDGAAGARALRLRRHAAVPRLAADLSSG